MPSANLRLQTARGLTATAGLVLFVCLFLPAIMTCNQVDYPYRYPPVYPIYLFGLFAAILALRRWPAHRAVKWLWTAFVGGLGAGIGLLVVYILWELAFTKKSSLVYIVGLVMTILWGSGSVGWLWVWRRKRPPLGPVQRGRLLQGIGAFYALAFFVPFTLDVKTLYGMYLAVGAATALLLAALLIPAEASPDGLGDAVAGSAREPP